MTLRAPPNVPSQDRDTSYNYYLNTIDSTLNHKLKFLAQIQPSELVKHTLPTE